MEIVNQTALRALPPLYSQEDTDNPVMYLKLISDDRSWTAYLAEGAQKGDDFVVFALFIGQGHSWSQMSVSELEDGLRTFGLDAHMEADFTPTPLDEVVGFRRHPRRIS